MDKECLFCRISITESRIKRHAKYCSEKCKREDYKRGYASLNKKLNLPTEVIGTISKNRVIVDLLQKGYQVFQEVGLASCDLGILKDGKFLRVETTTGKYIASGKVFYPPHNPNRYDVLAVVLWDRIMYQPQL